MSAVDRYARVLRAPDVARLLGAAVLARMPIGIDSLAIVLFTRAETGSFAAAVNRDEVRAGAEELGVDFDEHVAFVIAAMEDRADELGLHGRDADSAPASAG